IKLPGLTSWEVMQGEYRSMGLFPNGHVMSYLRPGLPDDVLSSVEVAQRADGEQVAVAGLVIRRQRPLAKAVFITLEDEYGHTPLIIWPKIYQRYKSQLREPFLLVRGTVSRREGTLNIMTQEAVPLRPIDYAPKARNWG
ncbi:MAG: OB-fold nucleic acid binding domain-containing protein, partial [Dehalococcoidia bacterium]